MTFRKPKICCPKCNKSFKPFPNWTLHYNTVKSVKLSTCFECYIK